MRRFNIRVLPGDGIIAEMTVYDLQKARITRRLREGQGDAPIATSEAAEEDLEVTESINEEA
jgi:hypothetical protein